MFEYKGRTYEPAGKVKGDFFQISRRLRRDSSTPNNYNNPNGYSYIDFYAISGECTDDLFRCIETGYYYIPCEHELMIYCNENGSFYGYN